MKKPIKEFKDTLDFYVEQAGKQLKAVKGLVIKDEYQDLMVILSYLGLAAHAHLQGKRANLTGYHAGESAAKGQTDKAYEGHIAGTFEDYIADALWHLYLYCAKWKVSLSTIREFGLNERFKKVDNVGESVFYLAGLLALLNGEDYMKDRKYKEKVIVRFLYFTYWACWHVWNIDIEKFLHLKIIQHKNKK